MLMGIIYFTGCTENEPVDYTNSKPFMEITNPKMNSNVPDSTTIIISTNIGNIIRVELYIDHSIRAIFNKPPYEYLWNTTYYTDGSQHILQAVAYNTNGDSIDSKFVIVNVYRFRPSNLQAFIKADTLIKLNWIDNSNFETGFQIEEAINDSNFFKIAEVDSNITTYSFINSFNLDTNYYFRVRAQSKDGYSGYTNIAKAVVELNKPINLNINYISDTAATFSWTDNNDFETGYVIAKQSSNGNVILKEVPANTTEAVVVDTFISGHYYNFLLYAKMGYLSGDAAYFPYVDFKFPAPYDLSLEGNNDHSLALSWDSDNKYNLGYLIERNDGGTGFHEIGRVTASSHTYTDINLDTAINYFYRVAAYSHFNQSDYSPELTALYSSQLNQVNKFQVASTISWMTVSDDASITAFGGYTSDNLAVYIYNTFTGQRLQTLYSADSTSQILQKITISPDNKLVAAAGNNEYITVWDINSGGVVKRINNVFYPNVMKFSYDGNYLIVERAGALRFYNIQTWQYETKLATSNYITYMAINSNETIIATSDRMTNVKLWNYNTGSLLREISSSVNAYPLKFNKAGTKLYSVINNELFAWDVSLGSIILTIPNFWRSNDIAISESKDIAVSSFNDGFGVWDLSSGNFIQKFPPDSEIGGELYFSPDDNYLIAREFVNYYLVFSVKKKWISPIVN